jgi:exo-1,4-beta-D-glucosaminidase
MGYPVGEGFTDYPMPADSLFRPAWWFRTEFDLPAAAAGTRVWLHVDGLNYRADVWVNGRRIAAADTIAGAARVFELDVTDAARAGARNTLALAIQPEEQLDLGHTWVDWNPMPPDKVLGLWRDVYVTASGPVRLRHPFVRTQLDGLDRALLTVSAELENTTDAAVTGLLVATLEGAPLPLSVTLGPGERRTVELTPATYPALTMASPRLWWPARLGAPELYDLDVRFAIDGVVADARALRFGIREITSELTEEGYRLYRVNGAPLLVRGAGWARNMFFMETPEREEQEVRLVLDMGLNAVRFEGKLGSDHLLDLADERGLLVIPGWCCCDQWERWGGWTEENRRTAEASLRDTLLLLRHRPSVLAFWYGSDERAPADVEAMYQRVIAETAWPNPALGSASERPGLGGPTGHKMLGPYEYVPPSYWLLDRDLGGAWGFATEVGPGKAIPGLESLRRMLGDEHLWPIDEAWTWHSQGNVYATFDLFNDALAARLGAPAGLADYVQKAQLLAYDGERAMFEAYGRNKYHATGVIQWMLNNAWPGVAWHLYDYYLAAGGGYYGTKKALEPLHVQYSYDDRSVVVVSSTRADAMGLTAAARVLTLDGAEAFGEEEAVDVPADAVVRALTIPAVTGLTPTYFVDLELRDAAGVVVSRNFYALSTTDDVLDWDHSTWFYTPTLVHADLTALDALPQTTVLATSSLDQDGDDERAHVTLTNPGAVLAFFVRVRLLGPAGDEVLPTLWEDNFVSLLPGETRTLVARWRAVDAGGATPIVAVDGWNVGR